VIERPPSSAKLLLFALLVASVALVAERRPTPPAAGTRAGTELDAALDVAFRAGTAKTASVAVVSASGCSFARTFGGGFGSLAGAANDDTVFRAASLSKPVLVWVALLLVKEGRLDLDRPFHSLPGPPLTRHPDWADLADDPRWKSITARHVLTHRTGLPNWRRQRPDRRLRFLFDPGTRFSYSGEGYRLLQHVVERIAGAGLESLAAARVFRPLGMTRTSYVWRPELEGNAAIDRKPIEAFLGPGILGRADAAGSLLTTARDYGRFLSAVLSGSGLTPSLREEMLRPQASIAADRLFGPPAATGPATGREPSPFWALGWGGFEDARGTARFHVGYDSPEYESYAVLYPARNLGVVVLTAGGSGPGSSSPGLARALLGHTRTPFAWMGYRPGSPSASSFGRYRPHAPTPASAAAIPGGRGHGQTVKPAAAKWRSNVKARESLCRRIRANDTQSVKLTSWSASLRKSARAACSSAGSGRRMVRTREAKAASARSAAKA